MNNFVQRAYIQSRLALNEKDIDINDDLIRIHGDVAI